PHESAMRGHSEFQLPVRARSITPQSSLKGSIGQRQTSQNSSPKQQPKKATMSAIDFASFVDQLASVSGDTILPFFRTALAIENKNTRGFDPVTAADR